MQRWSRRTFLGAAAAICVGCTDDSTRDGAGAATTMPADGSAGDAAGPGATAAEPTPSATASRGAIALGGVADLRRRVAAEGAVYVPEARAFVAALPDDAVEAAIDAHDEELHGGFRAGLVALHEKCPHLGCRVPFCESSGWFECACHGAWFNPAGEHQGGPSERGMDLLELEVVADEVFLLQRVHRGLPSGRGVVDVAADGPHCVELGPTDV